MSAVTQTQAPARPAAGGIPFSRMLQVEFRKSWDTRSGFWLLFSIGAIVFVAELITAIVTAVNDQSDIDFGTFASVAGFVTQFLLPPLGMMLVTSEWSQRTAMVTFALEPRRSRVVLAKLLVGLIWTAVTVVVAIVLGAVFNLLYGAIAGNIDWTLGWAGLTGFILGQAMWMLLGFALGTLVLNTPVAIVVYFVYLFGLPIIFGIGAGLMHWFKSLVEWIFLLQAQGPLYDGFWNMSASEWGKLLVAVGIWVALPLAIGLRRIMRAEVK